VTFLSEVSHLETKINFLSNRCVITPFPIPNLIVTGKSQISKYLIKKNLATDNDCAIHKIPVKSTTQVNEWKMIKFHQFSPFTAVSQAKNFSGSTPPVYKIGEDKTRAAGAPRL